MRDSWRTLVDALRTHAREIGDQVVFTFVSGPREERLTFAELDLRARATAVALREHCKPGDRAMLVYPVGLRYIEAFFGCMYAGVIAVPAYPPHPTHASRGMSKFLGIVRDSRPAAILTEPKLARMLTGVRERAPELNVPWVATSGDTSRAGEWTPPDISGDDLAFLQYTSGSTADPKGVMLRHRNLLANLELIYNIRPRRAGELLVSWLPPYHDMGLIGSILLPVYGGGPAVLMPPASFLQRPLWWLETIARFKGTYGAAPDFAYDLCVRAVAQGLPEGLDLSSWSMFLDGAEPVRANTINTFLRTFAPAGVPSNGIAPSYGLAEATLMVAVSDPIRGAVQLEVDPRELEQHRAVVVTGGGKTIVSSGTLSDAWDIRIVHPEQRRVLSNGQIGEIWVRGASVAAGYWEKPELTCATFEAQLAGGGGERFLRTGDLGFVHDAQLYVTGRIKEMICVRGRNLYPHDVERALEPLAASTPALRGACVAVGVEIGDSEELVIFAEVERRLGARRKCSGAAPGGERRLQERRKRRFEPRVGPAYAGRAEDDIAVAIATTVGRDLEARVAAVVLVLPGTLPRTSSGKSQRIACRKSFESNFADGTLHVVHVWHPGVAKQRAEPALQPSAAAVVQVESWDDPNAYERSERSYRELVEWLTARFSAKQNVPAEALDIQRPFVEFGLDSATAIEIAAQLSEFVDQALPPTLLWDRPNIDALASALARDRSDAPAVAKAEPAAQGGDAFAIVGMACKLPGADDLGAFWELLREGRSGITADAPRRFRELGGEFAVEALGLPPHAGFVSDIERFDAGFFSISAREAAEMDPQQRMLLEVGFHAMEDAGVPPSRWAGSRTGVFVGISSSDYGMIASRFGRAADVHSGTGNAHSIAANRLSYAFDLRGPSLAVDTACSSSLLAVHLACESLRRGESDAVVVAGVNAILSPLVTAAFCKAQMIAEDGRCKTFSADADGYVRSEGCGAVVLKRLADAKRDGDRIRAVVRGSFVAQDGRSNGLTAPNGGAQRDVLRGALASARLSPEDIDYVEAHGTGTSLGDPIEAAALGAVLGSPARERPWLLGAVKANLGHLESAAGMAGLIKLVLCLEHQTIPRQIHLSKLNPAIDLVQMRAEIPRENTAWPRAERTRRAGVSSFGFGGTNVHVIVEEAPLPSVARAHAEVQGQVLALSARSEASLRQLSQRMASRLASCDDADFVDACALASSSRHEFAHKLALIARTREQTVADLEAFAAGTAGARVRSRIARKASRIAFAFTGQGAQFPGMARELYAGEPVFREAVDRCERLLSGAIPLVSLLIDPAADPELLADTRITQPLLFSFQYALTQLWRSWGVEPDVVIGHSLGEYSAWCAASALSLPQALELVVRRAELMAQLPHGAMAAVVATEADVVDALAAVGGRVSIAGYNGTANLALAGPAADIDSVLAQLSSRGFGVRRLSVSHAFHSAMMDSMLPEFEGVLAQLHVSPARAQIISNVSGEAIEPAQVATDYFCQHTRQPVQFARGVRTLIDAGVRHVIEIGPQPVLSNLIKRLAAGELETLPSLKQGTLARDTLLGALAALHVAGHTPAWNAVHHTSGVARVVDLPAYPFERTRHWLDVQAGPRLTAAAPAAAPATLHPLLDRTLERTATTTVFEKTFDAKDLVIAQHLVESIAILPGVGFVEAMLAAARWHACAPVSRVENVLIVSPLALDDAGQAQMFVTASTEGERVQLSVTSRRRDGSEIRHASCECVTTAVSAVKLDLNALRAAPAQRVDAAVMYAGFQRVGIAYGEFFRSIRWVARAERETFALLELSPAAGAQAGYMLHPALLDAALQSFAALIADTDDVTQLYVPLTMGRVEIHAALDARVYVHARRTDSGTSATLPEVVRGSLSITDEQGNVVVSIEEFSLKRVRLERTIAEMIRSQLEGSSAAARLPSALRVELAPEQARLRALYAIESYAGVGTVVDALCTRYVIDALAGLGHPPRRGMAIDPAQIAATHALSTPHRKLLGRMLQMLEEDSACARQPDGSWQWLEDDTRERPPTIDELLERSPACSAELTMLRRCGENLSGVLRGELTPLELLFPDGSLRLAEALYQDSPFARYYNGMLQSAVRRIAAEDLGRPLRVLEIGAGTGGTTSYALPALAGADVHYVFSDVSRLFLMMAEKKFRGYAGLEYGVLDIERAPDTQGFEAGSFDLIIAANVLHATLDITQTLEHARWLLAPRGQLVLLEGTGRQRATDLIFGLTDGWWRFQDERLDSGYPLVSRARWIELLRSTGFADAAVLTEPDEATHWCEQLVIVAEADAMSRELSQPSIAASPVAVVVPELRPQPMAAAPVQRATMAGDAESEARRLIVTELANALRTTPDAVDLEQNFLDMGLDSLMAMEILGKLKSTWGINVQPTVLFEHTNALALAKYLADKYSDRLLAAPANVQVRAPAPPPTAAPAVRAPAPALRPRIARVDNAANDIAIIGMACRFPGASDLDAFWKILVDGRDMIGEIPVERWDTAQSGGSKYAGMLERIDLFDPQFFEISPREARLIDPQQRLFLEVAWEVAEHAGIAINGTNTGVFVGCTNADYFDRIKPFLTLDDYAAGLGNKNCIIPNRVSYVMNLRGPSVLVDTACSSSLVAMHNAMQSLRRGECTQAIAGGVNVLLSPLYYLALNRMGVQARDGRCKAFDHRADGFASGEGAGAVMLKPLARALADGDRVYAVVRGSAVNHDGRSAGLAAPNPAAHAELIEAAYRDAKLSPDSVSYIEAHGTGTALGDPIEIDGLSRAFRKWTQRKGYCAIGSVKSNMGHLEPAAGIAGVIKTVLCLQHRYLPPSLHFERPNPHIAFDETPFVVNAAGRAWEHAEALRAGVSSFGMGGTNAHVVLEDAPQAAPRSVRGRGVWMLPLSARTLPALRVLVARYADHVRARPELELDDVCFTAAVGRVAMKHRLAVLAEDLGELARTLTRLKEDSAWTRLDSRVALYGVGVAIPGLGSATVVHANRQQAEQAAGAFVRGASLESEPAQAARKTPLPTYPFERQRCWVDGASAPIAAEPARPAAPQSHPFLRKRAREAESKLD